MVEPSAPSLIAETSPSVVVTEIPKAVETLARKQEARVRADFGISIRYDRENFLFLRLTVRCPAEGVIPSLGKRWACLLERKRLK